MFAFHPNWEWINQTILIRPIIWSTLTRRWINLGNLLHDLERADIYKGLRMILAMTGWEQRKSGNFILSKMRWKNTTIMESENFASDYKLAHLWELCGRKLAQTPIQNKHTRSIKRNLWLFGHINMKVIFPLYPNRQLFDFGLANQESMRKMHSMQSRAHVNAT